MSESRHGEAWGANWWERLAKALERQGVSSLLEFAQKSRSTTYDEIANALEGPFAPIQVMMFIRKEFEDRADAMGFVADCLYRYLHQHSPGEADSRESREFKAALATGAWEAAMGAGNEQSVSEVWTTLKERVLGGWLPNSPDDPVLLDALRHPWRIESWRRPTGSA